MSRSIVTAPSRPVVRDAFPDLADESPQADRVAVQGPQEPDKYRDRLFKYIPGEVVTLYLFLGATVADKKNPHFLVWLIFFVGLIATPFYLRVIQKVSAPIQLVISTVAFAVWVFALGGPFSDLDWYKPVYGAVVLPVFTFFVAGIAPAPSPPNR
jgi:hypothetical protein